MPLLMAAIVVLQSNPSLFICLQNLRATLTLTRQPSLVLVGYPIWRDAAEFIALGATSVQVCTAVMHHGYRIVEDMIEGLKSYCLSTVLHR